MGQQVQRNPNPQANELLLKVAEMIKNQFDLKPKGLTFLYKRSYLEGYDLVALSTNYRLSEPYIQDCLVTLACSALNY